MKSTSKPTRRIPTLTARDIMSADVVTVVPSLSLRAAAGVLRDHAITGAAVVNDTGMLIGVVSETDLVDREAQPRVRSFVVKESRTRSRAHPRPAKTCEVLQAVEEPMDSGTVGDVFSPYVITATPDASVADLAALMVRHRVHRLFIVAGQALAGVVSSMDVMKAVALVEQPARSRPARHA